MMKNTITALIIFTMITGADLSAQDYARLKEISLNNKEDCKKAESTVLSCSNSLLSTACTENLQSLNAIVFLIRWMGATPDHTFALNDDLYGAIKSNEVLAGRYYAALAKTALETGVTGNDKLQFESIKLFLDYCEQPGNGVKVTKKLRKFIDAKNNGTLAGLISGS